MPSGKQGEREAYRNPGHYQPIHMPKNTSAGVIIGAFSLVMGFALIWHIWWLAIVGLVGSSPPTFVIPSTMMWTITFLSLWSSRLRNNIIRRYNRQG